MYKISSTSGNLTTLQVVKDGRLKTAHLLPKNFILSEVVTEQMKNLEKSKVIRIREYRGSLVSGSCEFDGYANKGVK